MEILTTYDFTRPSRSQYAPIAKALIDDKAPIVRIKRGEDFSEKASIASVRGAVSDSIAKRGHRARTHIESEDVLVIALWAEGEGPQRRRKNKRQAVAA